jgi:hypothetical protein
VPDVAVVPDFVVVPVDVDPVDVEPAPVVAVDEGLVPVADPVDVSSDDVELAELVEDVPVVSAAATPWPVATAVTSHAATAIPPYPPSFAARWDARRDDKRLVGAGGGGAANRGLTGG